MFVGHKLLLECYQWLPQLFLLIVPGYAQLNKSVSFRAVTEYEHCSILVHFWKLRNEELAGIEEKKRLFVRALCSVCPNKDV